MEQTADIEKLPDAIPRGLFKPVNLPSGHDPTFVMFDLETTDLSKTIFILYNIFLLDFIISRLTDTFCYKLLHVEKLTN
jgi:hypothetical protein